MSCFNSNRVKFITSSFSYSAITERELIKWEGIGILYSSLVLFACNLFFRYESMEQKTFNAAMSLCVILFVISLFMIAGGLFNYIPLSDGVYKVIRRVFMYMVLVMLVCAIFITFGCTKCADQFAVFALLLQVAILLSMVAKDFYSRMRSKNEISYTDLNKQQQQNGQEMVLVPEQLNVVVATGDKQEYIKPLTDAQMFTIEDEEKKEEKKEEPKSD
jgi:hypothetical protein